MINQKLPYLGSVLLAAALLGGYSIQTQAVKYTAQSAAGQQIAQVNSPVPTTPAPQSPSNVTPMATYGPILGPTATPINAGPAATTTTATPSGTIVIGTVTPTFTPSISSTPSPSLAKNLMGVQLAGNLSDVDWNKGLDYAHQLGVGWIKIQVQWKVLQPTKDTYSDLYRGLVQDIQRAHTSGFKTLIGIDKAPDWTRSPGTHANDGPPTDPNTLAAFLTKFVGDVKPEFVDALEIWNEPNLRSEWDGATLNGATYMTYFDASYKAIRAEEQLITPTFGQHHIIIITAAPATGTPDSADTVSDRTWLKQLYAAKLAQYGGDIAVGAHPYGWGNAPEADCCTPGAGVTGWYNSRSFFFKDTLDDYHQIMTENQHNAQIWITEFGWATFDGLHASDGTAAKAPTDPGLGWMNILNQSQQADYTLRALVLTQHAPYNTFLGPSFLWNLNFATVPGLVDAQSTDAGFSMTDYNYAHRPVFDAVAGAPKQ